MTRLYGKWDFAKHEYLPYEIPDEWHCPLVTELHERINCTSCGKIIEYGEAFTSRRIHTIVGFGYPVCESCYTEERAEEAKHKGNEASTNSL